MVVETTVKVKLTKEEKETLKKAYEIINAIDNETCDYNCDLEYEDEIDYLLDDMQVAIRAII